MPSLPRIASVAASTVVKVVSSVGLVLGGYKMLMEGLKLLGEPFREGANAMADPTEIAVGIGLFAIGAVGWWVADQIGKIGSPHMQQAEAARLNGMAAARAR